LGICRYNGLGLEELVDDQLDNSEDEATAAEARRAQYDQFYGEFRQMRMEQERFRN
nr:hypothetical protein [Tanacetum cinerariifolium]